MWMRCMIWQMKHQTTLYTLKFLPYYFDFWFLKFGLNHFLIRRCDYIFNGNSNWAEMVSLPFKEKKESGCHFDWRKKQHFSSSRISCSPPPAFRDSFYLDSVVYFHTILCQPWQLSQTAGLKWMDALTMAELMNRSISVCAVREVSFNLWMYMSSSSI